MGLAELVAELKGMAMPEQEAQAAILVADALGPSEGYVYISIGRQPTMVIRDFNLERTARTLVALSQLGVSADVFAGEYTAKRLYIEVAGLGGNAGHSTGEQGYQAFSSKVMQH